LKRLHDVLEKGLGGTARLWPEVEAGFGWLHRAATILGNATGEDAATVRRRYGGLLGAMSRHRAKCGSLGEATAQFLKVSRSYWGGLFWCYQVAELPRTNNDLEQFFGSYRYHERRCSGRKVACPGTVVRGRVRLVSAATSRLRSVSVEDLIPSDVSAWRALRAELEKRQATRTLGRRFRKGPDAYLHTLEDTSIKNVLPP
jgi:hypothetical protein